MVDTVRTQAELLAFLHPNIGNPMPDATVLVSQAARDLIVSIPSLGEASAFFPDGPDPTGTTASGFASIPANSTTYRARRMTILDGSSANPILTDTVTAWMSSTHRHPGSGVQANTTTLEVISEGHGTVGPGGFGQTQALVGVSSSVASDMDACAISGIGFINVGALHANRAPTAFGSFFDAVSYDPYGFACASNPFVAVGSSTPLRFDGGKFSSGLFIQTMPSSTALTNSFKVVISNGTSANVSRQFPATITGNPGAAVVTATRHDIAENTAIQFTTTGSLPTGLSVGVTYYALGVVTNQLRVSATPGGANIIISSAGSGTHTIFAAHGLIDGNSFVLSTTGALPAPLATGTTYFVSGAAAFAFDLSATLGGANINTTTNGSGVHTLTPYVEVGPGAITFANATGNAQFSQGYATFPGSVSQQGFLSNDSAQSAFKDTGTHVDGFDASGTYSGLSFKAGPGFGLSKTAGPSNVLGFESGYGFVHNTTTHITSVYGNSSPRAYFDGAWVPTANQTFLHLFEGAVPTDRQVQWKLQSALVAADKVMVLV